MTPVSIIIPAWNEAKTITRTIRALVNIDYELNFCELLVVAGGDDDTYTIAQGLAARVSLFDRYVVIRQTRHGTKNAAIQQGLREARNAIIALLDADTIVGKTWLKKMITPLEQNRADLTIANSTPVKRNWISDYPMIIKSFNLDRVVTHPGHSLVFGRVMVADEPEYFFEKDVWMGDDYVFETKIRERGYRTMFVIDADVKTHYPSSLKPFFVTELYWHTAAIHLRGFHLKTLSYNLVLIASLAVCLSLSPVAILLAVIFNLFYVAKQIRVFVTAATRYKTQTTRLPGFIFLSYASHLISLLAHLRYFFGHWTDPYYQGERT